MARGVNIPLNFRVNGLSEVLKSRNALASFSQKSYINFDTINRGVGEMEKRFKSLHHTIGHLAFGFGAGGLAYAMGHMVDKLFHGSAELQTNTIILKSVLDGNQEKTDAIMEDLKKVSLTSGLEFNQVAHVGRGMALELRNYSKDFTPQQLNTTMMQTATLALMDPLNRGIQFAGFAYKKMMEGAGKADFLSFIKRFELR